MITTVSKFGDHRISQHPAKVLLFGSGATGRGHVGLLAWQAGYELVMVDRDNSLVKILADAGQYTVRLYGGKRQPGVYSEVIVSGYRVLPHLERTRIASEMVDSSLVLTAVFDQNLPDVAENDRNGNTRLPGSGEGNSDQCRRM